MFRIRKAMKPATVLLALGAAACADMPAAEIGGMSDDGISVVYYDGISGMGDATAMAKEHCGAKGTSVIGKTAKTGGTVDKTVVDFACKPPKS